MGTVVSDILVGKPAIKGASLAVEFIVDLLEEAGRATKSGRTTQGLPKKTFTPDLRMRAWRSGMTGYIP